MCNKRRCPCNRDETKISWSEATGEKKKFVILFAFWALKEWSSFIFFPSHSLFPFYTLSISHSLSQFTFTHQTQKIISLLFFCVLFFFFFSFDRKISKWIAFLYFSLFVCWFSFTVTDSLSLSRNMLTRLYIFLTDFLVVFFSDKSAFLKSVISFFFSFYSVGRVKLCEFPINKRVIFFCFFLSWVCVCVFVCIVFSMKYYHRHKWMINVYYFIYNTGYIFLAALYQIRYDWFIGLMSEIIITIR